MLFSPMIGAAVTAGYWFLWVRCPACRTINVIVDGRLPYGMGIARLTDLPAEWSRQREMLGFPSH
jgi:hypothetical protein